jgi:glucosamine kinase
MRQTGSWVERIARRLTELGARRMSLMGGLAGSLAPYLPQSMRPILLAPMGDALSGALHLARVEAARPGMAVSEAP